MRNLLLLPATISIGVLVACGAGTNAPPRGEVAQETSQPRATTTPQTDAQPEQKNLDPETIPGAQCETEYPIDPSAPASYPPVARCYRDAGLVGREISIWDQLIRRHPGSPEATAAYLESALAHEQVYKLSPKKHFLRSAATLYERYVGQRGIQKAEKTQIITRAACIRHMLQDERELKRNLHSLGWLKKGSPTATVLGENACKEAGPIPFPDRHSVALDKEEKRASKAPAKNATNLSARCANVTQKLDEVLPVYARTKQAVLVIKGAERLPVASGKTRRNTEHGPIIYITRHRVQFDSKDLADDASIAKELERYRRWSASEDNPVVYLAASRGVRGSRLAAIVRSIGKGDGTEAEIRLVVRTGREQTAPATSTEAFAKWHKSLSNMDSNERAVARAEKVSASVGLCAALVEVFGNLALAKDTAMHLATRAPQALRDCNCAVDMDMIPPILETSLIPDETQGWVPIDMTSLRKSKDVGAYVTGLRP